MPSSTVSSPARQFVAVLKRKVTSVIGDDRPSREPFAAQPRLLFLTCWPWGEYFCTLYAWPAECPRSPNSQPCGALLTAATPAIRG